MRVSVVLAALLAFAMPAWGAQTANDAAALRGSLDAFDEPDRADGIAKLERAGAAASALSLDVRHGHSSNAEGFSGGRASPVTELGAAFETRRRIGRLDLGLGLRGALEDPVRARRSRYRALEGQADLGVDAGPVRVETGIDFRAEDDAGERHAALGASAGLARAAGAVRPYARLRAERVAFAPQRLTPDLVLSNEGRAHRLLAGEAGLGWRRGEAWRGRLSAGALAWDYARPRDDFGLARDARGVFLRGALGVSGARAALSVDARLVRRMHADPLLDDETVLILDAEGVYALNARTRLSLAVRSDLEETNLPGASARVTRFAEIALERDLTERTALRLGTHLERETLLGLDAREAVRGLSAGLARRLNEHLVADIVARYERGAGTLQGADFSAFAISLGLSYAFEGG